MKNPPPAMVLRKDSAFVRALKHINARSGGKGSGDGGKHGDENVEDFVPEVLVFHDFLVDS
jgi:hypothetical protein